MAWPLIDSPNGISVQVEVLDSLFDETCNGVALRRRGRREAMPDAAQIHPRATLPKRVPPPLSATRSLCTYPVLAFLENRISRVWINGKPASLAVSRGTLNNRFCYR
jgi:hypothetical protein